MIKSGKANSYDTGKANSYDMFFASSTVPPAVASGVATKVSQAWRLWGEARVSATNHGIIKDLFITSAYHYSVMDGKTGWKMPGYHALLYQHSCSLSTWPAIRRLGRWLHPAVE
jgi:hypothetical protein